MAHDNQPMILYASVSNVDFTSFSLHRIGLPRALPKRKDLSMNKDNLTRAQIVENIHTSLGIPKSTILKIIELFYETVKEGLIQGRTIELRGFGTFYVKQRKGRIGRNPKTGKKVEINTHGVALFRPGLELKREA